MVILNVFCLSSSVHLVVLKQLFSSAFLGSVLCVWWMRMAVWRNAVPCLRVPLQPWKIFCPLALNLLCYFTRLNYWCLLIPIHIVNWEPHLSPLCLLQHSDLVEIILKRTSARVLVILIYSSLRTVNSKLAELSWSQEARRKSDEVRISKFKCF